MDLLTNGEDEHELRAERSDNRHTRDGMHLASAVASYLALGYDVPAAAGHAKSVHVTARWNQASHWGRALARSITQCRWRGRDPKSA